PQKTRRFRPFSGSNETDTRAMRRGAGEFRVGRTTACGRPGQPRLRERVAAFGVMDGAVAGAVAPDGDEPAFAGFGERAGEDEVAAADRDAGPVVVPAGRSGEEHGVGEVERIGGGPADGRPALNVL